MRFQILVTLILISQSAFSQLWFDDDHSWVYRYHAWSNTGYSEVYVSHDTILNGLEAKVLKRNIVGVDLTSSVQDTAYIQDEDLIMREEDDRVYYWDEDSFALCYDFNLGIYDVMIFSRPDCGPDIWWTIMDTGVVMINGVQRKIQEIRVDDIERSMGTDYIKVIQGLGIVEIEHPYWGVGFGFLVPQITYPCYADYDNYGFCSFTDNGKTFKIDTSDCYKLPQVKTSANDINLDQLIKISPNPFSSSLRLDFPEGIDVEKIKIYNSQGQNVPFNKSSEIELVIPDADGGLYYITIHTNRGMITRKLYSYP